MHARSVAHPALLADRAAAIWLMLASCRGMVDDETDATITDAMTALDEVAALARALASATPGGMAPCPDLREVDELACAIYEFVRGAAAERDEHTGPPPRRP